ncbi:hypothetical protein DENSPDRAFT_743266, partial [Dentipellis sp. KUC8613]
MKANAIMFQMPMPKIYQALPPPRSDMDKALAYIFIGPIKPTEQDHRRTPLLVRRNKVKLALEWLKLNHSDYADLDISESNLQEYPENVPPIVCDYRLPPKEKESENLAVNQQADEDGTTHGPCPFIVHTLTANQLTSSSTSNIKTVKAHAIRHLMNGNAALGIGRAPEPESIFNNPQLYPQTFPWLFPYGLGGIGNTNGFKKVSDSARKKSLLLYHDK